MKKLLKSPWFWTAVILVVATCAYLLYLHMKRQEVVQSSTEDNVKAFLTMIRRCEHVAGDEGYNTVYGGGKFYNMADHPAITGEWTGKVLTDTQCRNAGFGPGCKSTAAGAYQFIKPTWLRMKNRYALPDFSKGSQDIGGAGLLDEIGVLSLVRAGRITEALASKVLGQQWASLPTATTKQNPKSLATAKGYYTAAGGTITA